MHKSTAFTFGLLASSLVMLVLVPFMNQQQQNIFSNVMAQESNNDNSYGDNSYYSQYPTDDKKYECRTGPFEGFFVSSVEFCKHVKFDDKKDRAGPQGIQGERGPEGPAGPEGPEGPQGPAGINVINAANLYPAIGDPTPVTTSPVGFATSTATCDDEDIAISGSFQINPVNPGTTGTYDIVFNGQTGTIPSNVWETQIIGQTGTTVQTVGFCFDNPPPH